VMYRGQSFVGRVFVSAVVRKLGYVLVAGLFAFFATQCHAAQCVSLNGDGTLTATADPVESCAGFLLATSTEFTGMQSVVVPLSLEDAGAIGWRIFLLWSVAFIWRVLRQSLGGPDHEVEGG
jgi:hypothetical protein